MKKSILVTGGAGYIGSHTVRLLVQDGYAVTVLDNLVYGHREAIVDDSVELVVGDIGDQDLTRELFAEKKFDAVVHFAAYTLVGESVTDPAKYYENNIAIPLKLLDVMREFECKEFIFSSTCATYGNPQYMPLDEKHPQNPINPYGMSKLMLEKVIEDYNKAYGLNYVFLRYFNAAGSSKDGLIGEDHTPETHLIPLILDTLNGKREFITVFGTDYDTEDGTCVRDYIHVNDLGGAHLKALEYLSNGGASTAVNLGTGQGVSVQKMIDTVEKVTGKKVPVKYGERREGDPPVLVANPEKAKTVLGWEAQIIDVEEIVSSAWMWKGADHQGAFSAMKLEV